MTRGDLHRLFKRARDRYTGGGSVKEGLALLEVTLGESDFGDRQMADAVEVMWPFVRAAFDPDERRLIEADFPPDSPSRTL